MLWKNCVNEELPGNKYHKNIKYMSKLVQIDVTLISLVHLKGVMFGFRKCLYTHPTERLGNSWGWGRVSEMYEVQLEFP